MHFKNYKLGGYKNMNDILATLRDLSNLKGRKLDLQMFADDGGTGDPPADGGQPNDHDKPKDGDNNEPDKLQDKDKTDDKSKTYTQAELEALLQTEADRRVTEALKTSRGKWQKELEDKLDEKIKEAEKMAKMKEDEKQKYILELKEKELAEKEREIQLKELKLSSIDILNEKKLPITLVDMLVSADLDEEQTKKNIEAFEKVFRAEVQKAVDERLKSKPPGKGNVDGDKDIGSEIAKSRNQEFKPKINPWA